MSAGSVATSKIDTQPFICEMVRICFVSSGRRWPILQVRDEYKKYLEDEDILTSLHSHQSDLVDHELMKYYKQVSDKVELPCAKTKHECAIPYLKKEHLDYFLNDVDLTWSVAGAMIFTVIRLTMVRIDSCDCVGCIPQVVGLLSSYFVQKHLDTIIRLGGWGKFFNALKGISVLRMNILPSVNRFDAKWRVILPAIPPSNTDPVEADCDAVTS